MISKINLNKIASYKTLVTLETDKKVNLIYGLNGTGKSTLSNYLYLRENHKYANCSIEGLTNEDILVYNQSFVQDYFHESESLKGIFTLSKENKVAEETIKAAEKVIKELKIEQSTKEKEFEFAKADIKKKQGIAENKTWSIKNDYTNNKSELEFCLDGLKGSKEKLFSHIESIPKPKEKPEKSIEDIKAEVKSFDGENAQRYNLLPEIDLFQLDVESNELLQKAIVGNENSTIAELISKLGNSDWVKDGLKYLPHEVHDANESCPFCQQKTISQVVLKNIQSYFDESYERDLNSLRQLFLKYQESVNSIPNIDIYSSNPILKKQSFDFQGTYNKLLGHLKENLKKIEDKIKTPSQSVVIPNSDEMLLSLLQIITSVNIEIEDHNKKIDNKREALTAIKLIFWNIMRWDYDQTISAQIDERITSSKKMATVTNRIVAIDNNIKAQSRVIEEQQKNTLNIEGAIGNINNGLIDLGIEGISIVKHSENLYKIVREDGEGKIFQTLSEGEKMIISFLYFIELCRGKKDASESGRNKIIVIDDPISSLSHIYIFNIGQLIRKEFLLSKDYEQVFLLTHSLYFFYELTDTNHDRRKENQNLFRLVKNSEGSKILTMKYEEIQNDYHSYWHIINDENHPPALIANCMRNIIEYFFNFIEKTDLNNVFQKPELQENKYQAFCRYINRESHSLGQNIFDYKEFNYNDFRNALALVFKASGYEEHYKKMTK